MSDSPLITFKAGKCENAPGSKKVTAVPTPGYLYLYSEDELIHFCWRPRNSPSTEPEVDLLMVPGDGTFSPVLKEPGAEDLHSPTSGRIFVLRFASSGEKRYFWMQSRSQHRDGTASWFSERDQRLGQIVDSLLQGEDVDIEQEVEEIRRGGGGNSGGDDTDMMDADQPPEHHRQGSGGAGPDATGADPRDEGEASREGGADGGRAASGQQQAPQDTDAIVQNFLRSLQQGGQSSGSPQQQQQAVDKPFTSLPELLPSSTTIPYIDLASSDHVDRLCTFLPPEVFLLAQESADSFSSAKATPAAAEAAIAALSQSQKKDIIKRALRSPQFQQSLGSLTVALRDGGLPMIGDALGLKVANGGLIRGGSMPLGGGEAVEAFVQGVRGAVEEEEAKKGSSGN
ncbi:hypothetical protein K431DRAFT_311465 [Polychaeton citri CBS 116435]|uniref:Pru domain-containing protein n=1 Tax=Polychaeton citri CBS 116435 TaxID=1314669 RepID=A0A9P4URF9_9PEZI|nr:hypothetical protein K431DRAFT_311465 [Polychaeton citri CBS 116435]